MIQSLELLIETKRFSIPSELLVKLRELQSETRRYYTDRLAESEDAVVMTGGMGTAMYLALDGRVIFWDDFIDETKPPREVKDIKEMFTAVVIGAKRRKSPELLALLPLRPKEASDCLDCNCSGWRQFGSDIQGEQMEIICWNCGGIGWIIND